MSKVSFEDIGAVIATFAAQDGVKPGQMVKITANGEVGACSANDAFAGHICPQCGQFQEFPWALKMGSKSERKQSPEVVIPQCLLPQGKNRGQAPERRS